MDGNEIIPSTVTEDHHHSDQEFPSFVDKILFIPKLSSILGHRLYRRISVWG